MRTLYSVAYSARRSAVYGSGVINVANQVGKRYQCTKCNTEMIVTKAGDGELGCCGQPMQQKQ